MLSHQPGPAADAHPGVQRGGQEDDEQQGEEEGCAAYKLKEVEAGAADAAVDHLLQDEGHQGQQLTRDTKHQHISSSHQESRLTAKPVSDGQTSFSG